VARQAMESGDSSKTSGSSDKMPYGQNDNFNNKDLSKSIDEVNTARNAMSPQQYNQFLKQSLNELLFDDAVVPTLNVDSEDGDGKEESGKMPARMLNEAEVQKMVGIGTMQLISSNSAASPL